MSLIFSASNLQDQTLMRLSLLLFLTLVISASSCRSKKVVSESRATVNAKALLEEILENEQEYEFLKSGGSVKVEANGQKLSGQFSLRMQRDSLVWLSLRFAFIEAYRILIMPDSFIVMDRLKREYFKDNTDNLATLFGTNPEIALIQNTIIGNVTHLDQMGIEVIANEDLVRYISSQDSFMITMLPEGDLKRPRALKIEHQTKEGQLDVQYEVYQQDETGTFPSKTIFLFDNADFNALEINFSKFSKVEEISFPFKIPSSYSEAR